MCASLCSRGVTRRLRFVQNWQVSLRSLVLKVLSFGENRIWALRLDPSACTVALSLSLSPPRPRPPRGRSRRSGLGALDDRRSDLIWVHDRAMTARALHAERRKDVKEAKRSAGTPMETPGSSKDGKMYESTFFLTSS